MVEDLFSEPVLDKSIVWSQDLDVPFCRAACFRQASWCELWQLAVVA